MQALYKDRATGGYLININKYKALEDRLSQQKLIKFTITRIVLLFLESENFFGIIVTIFGRIVTILEC
jgi:hypothetical protein